MRRVLLLLFLLTAFESSYADIRVIDEMPGVPPYIPMLLPNHQSIEDQHYGIIIEVDDLEAFKKLTGIEIISHGLCTQNTWLVFATAKKSDALAILNLPFVISVKFVKPETLIVSAQ